MVDKNVRRGKSARMIKRRAEFPLRKINYIIFSVALAIIIMGYVALAQRPADNVWSLTVAPILLVIGYCVLIPIAIFYTGRNQPRQNL